MERIYGVLLYLAPTNKQLEHPTRGERGPFGKSIPPKFTRAPKYFVSLYVFYQQEFSRESTTTKKGENIHNIKRELFIYFLKFIICNNLYNYTISFYVYVN